jgi:hypothetical protein
MVNRLLQGGDGAEVIIVELRREAQAEWELSRVCVSAKLLNFKLWRLSLRDSLRTVADA